MSSKAKISNYEEKKYKREEESKVRRRGTKKNTQELPEEHRRKADILGYTFAMLLIDSLISFYF